MLTYALAVAATAVLFSFNAVPVAAMYRYRADSPNLRPAAHRVPKNRDESPLYSPHPSPPKLSRGPQTSSRSLKARWNEPLESFKPGVGTKVMTAVVNCVLLNTDEAAQLRLPAAKPAAHTLWTAVIATNYLLVVVLAATTSGDRAADGPGAARNRSRLALLWSV
jgi:hypothetical protein